MDLTSTSGRDPVGVLRTVPAFAMLEPQQLAQLASRSNRHIFEKGQTIFQLGDPADCLFVIVRGRVGIGFPSETGRPVIHRVLEPGEVFGELALLDGKARSASAVAMDPTETLALHRDDFPVFLRLSPPSAYMLDVLTQRLGRRERELTAISQISAALSALTTLDDVDSRVRQTLEAAVQTLDAGIGTVFLHDPARRKLIFKYVIGEAADLLTGCEIEDDRGTAGQVFQSEAGVITRLATPTEYSLLAGQPTNSLTRSIVTVPLSTMEGQCIGALQMLNKRDGDFDEEDLQISTIVARHAASAIETAKLYHEQRLAAEALQQAKEALETARSQELTIARSIQTRLLPAGHIRLEGYEVLSRSEPALEVGGDFFNFFAAGRGNPHGEHTLEADTAGLGIVLGDVSGKGIPGALFMALTTTLIEGQAQLLHSPAETLAATNAQLYPKMRRRDSEQPPMFATAVYGVLDTSRGEIRLANAGQTPPIYWPAGGEPRYIRLPGVPLGALPGTKYQETVLRLDPGDRLLFCSDGFIEDRDARGEQVGYGGFLRRLIPLDTHSGPDLVEALFGAEHESGADLLERDDRTLVLVTAGLDESRMAPYNTQR